MQKQNQALQTKTVDENNDNKPQNKKNKILLLIIIGFVAIGFMGFGIIDFLKGISGSVNIVKVGTKKITIQEFEKSYQYQASRLVNQYGANNPQLEKVITSQDFKNIVLSDLINKNLLKQYLQTLGINLNYQTMINIIKQDSKFITQGKFDKEKFTQYLMAMGMNQNEYIENEIYEIASTIILTNIVSQNGMYNDILTKYKQSKNQLKNIEIYTFNEAFAKQVDPKFTNEVNSDEVKKYYEKNSDDYLIPQTREVLYVNLFDSIYTNSTVSTQDAKRFYDNQILPHVIKNEKRSIYLALFSVKEKANQAYNEIKSGKSFEEVTTKYLNVPINNMLLKDIKRDEFEVSLSSKIFNMKAGETSNIIETPLGYYIVKVLLVNRDQTKSFEKIQNEVKAAIKFDSACQKAKQLFNEIEDFSLNTPDFESITKKFSLNFANKTFTESLAEQKDKLTTEIFLANSNSTKYPIFVEDTTPSKICNYYVVKIQKINNGYYKAIDEVRTDIINKVKNLKLSEQLLRLANSFDSLKQKPQSYQKQIDVDFAYEPYPKLFQSQVDSLYRQNQISSPIITKNSDVLLIKLINKTQSLKKANITLTEEDLKKDFISREYNSAYLSLSTKLGVKIYDKNYSFIN